MGSKLLKAFVLLFAISIAIGLIFEKEIKMFLFYGSKAPSSSFKDGRKFEELKDSDETEATNSNKVFSTEPKVELMHGSKSAIFHKETKTDDKDPIIFPGSKSGIRPLEVKEDDDKDPIIFSGSKSGIRPVEIKEEKDDQKEQKEQQKSGNNKK